MTPNHFCQPLPRHIKSIFEKAVFSTLFFYDNEHHKKKLQRRTGLWVHFKKQEHIRREKSCLKRVGSLWLVNNVLDQ